jgi:hypothetical protein
MPKLLKGDRRKALKRLLRAEQKLIELLASPEPDAELYSECILSAADERLGSIQHCRDRIKHLVALLGENGEESQQ